jgi:hypothetical protein
MGEEKQSKDEKEYLEALDFLGLNKEEVDSKAFISHKIGQNIQEKVTQINQFALDFRMILEGKEFREELGGYRQCTRALCSFQTITLLSGIVQNYAQNCNLISKKDDEKFSIQLYDAWSKQQNVLLRDRATPERTHRVISKIFKDCLVNIGDIITNSDKNMERVFAAFNKADTMDEYERLKSGF